MQDWIEYIKIIKDITKEKKIGSFLVGGALRDLYLGREFKDVDIVVNKRAADVARYFADKICGSFVILDESRNIYRVVKDNLFFDFAMMVGESIETDLQRRDFTINAIACSIFSEGCADDKLINLLVNLNNNTYLDKTKYCDLFIDPFNGINDLKSQKIRAVGDNIFKEDPLRLWRAIRLKSQLSFNIDDETVKFMKECNSLASVPASERIREEFVKILETESVFEEIRYMEKEFNLLSSIIPGIDKMKDTGENKHHQEDAWIHSLLVFKALEELLLDSSFSKLIENNKIYLLKLTTLLHDIGKIVTRTKKGEKTHYFGHENAGAEMVIPILKELKFSREEISFIKRVIQYHMRPMLLYIAENLTNRGRFRFFKQVGSLTPVVLLHSLADKTAAMKINDRQEEIGTYRNYIKDMLQRYYDYRSRTANLLLSGDEIKEHLKIKEGPEIGDLMDKLGEAQARGQVSNKKEAIDYLSKIK